MPTNALALDWPDDPDVAKTDDAWMVGDQLLVAPLFAGEPGRRLTLPPGVWHNFWTGDAIAGNSTIDLPAATQNIPVFVMDGSVLPLAVITNSTADPASRTLKVRIFGDGHLPFSLTTHEGDSLELRWDIDTRVGTVKQRGNNPYIITKWTSVPSRSSQLVM